MLNNAQMKYYLKNLMFTTKIICLTKQYTLSNKNLSKQTHTHMKTTATMTEYDISIMVVLYIFIN